MNVEEKLEELQSKLYEIKKRADSVIESYNNSPTYTITESEGSVDNYKYFLYPYKNFGRSLPKDEEFVAKHLAHFIDPTVDYLVTFEADGIGITKLISVITDIPMLVCKTFHYNQPVFKFTQKTGYFERDMYCPKLVEGKKIAIVDCMVSTGGTVSGLVGAINDQKINTDIKGIYTVVNKTNYQESPDLFGTILYKYLFNVVVNEHDKVESVISDNFRDAYWTYVNSNIMEFIRDLSTLSDISRNDFTVGAVVVDDETLEVLGYGWTGSTKHAEDNAITMAKKNHDLTGRILVVYTTLEPCIYRTVEGEESCSSMISKIPEIKWIVIDRRDDKDDKNFHEGIKQLSDTGKYVVCFEDHPSIALNYDPSLSERTTFAGHSITK